jgi:hypothetical protein
MISQRASMPTSVPVIGVEPAELPWLRTLVQLLRHPDPAVVELTRQALIYLQTAAAEPKSLDPTG